MDLAVIDAGRGQEYYSRVGCGSGRNAQAWPVSSFCIDFWRNNSENRGMSPLFCRFRTVVIGATAFLSGAGLCSGAEITSPSYSAGYLGEPAEYQITADNFPSSFEATNLPPGMSLNGATGRISGLPTISGTHYTEVVAHGQGDARATIGFTVYIPSPPDDPPDGGMGVQCIAMLADPNRPRIYCAGSNQELDVIDTNTMSVTARFSSVGNIQDLSLSPDSRTLWFSRTYYYNSLAKLNLNTLDGVVAFPTDVPIDVVRQGPDNRVYAATRNIQVMQLDATTGAVQQRFQPSESDATPGLRMEVSPDRRTLYLAWTYRDAVDIYLTHAVLSRYDITTPTPTFVQQVEIPSPKVYGITVSPDGGLLYLNLGTTDGYASRKPHQTLCLSATDLTTRGALSFLGTSSGPVSISPNGTRVLQMVALGDGGGFVTGLVEIFDARNFQLLRTVAIGTGHGIFFFGGAVLNQAGSAMFVATQMNPGLRMYDVTETPPPETPPKSLLNISTRMVAQRGDNVVIGGFIVKGSGANLAIPGAVDSKKVILRAIGPSLPLPGKLNDPVLELHGPGGEIIAENSNWNSHRGEVLATGLAPSNEYEAAIVATLQPGAYSAVLRGSGGTTGIAVVEAYDLSASGTTRLANISTRGKVEPGDNVMIGGWIIGGREATNMVIRAIGPSLAGSGISGPLADPTLDVYNGDGILIAQNDDWRSDQADVLIGSGLAPTDDRESAVLMSLVPGPYTAIVRGNGDTTGVALVELYNLR